MVSIRSRRAASGPPADRQSDKQSMNTKRPPERSNFHPAVACPKCGGSARRVPRRQLDRVLSLFGRVHRFRCTRETCGWIGSVRMKPTHFPDRK
jgi:hypothetical protein